MKSPGETTITRKYWTDPYASADQRLQQRRKCVEGGASRKRSEDEAGEKDAYLPPDSSRYNPQTFSGWPDELESPQNLKM